MRVVQIRCNACGRVGAEARGPKATSAYGLRAELQRFGGWVTANQGLDQGRDYCKRCAARLAKAKKLWK